MGTRGVEILLDQIACQALMSLTWRYSAAYHYFSKHQDVMQEWASGTGHQALGLHVDQSDVWLYFNLQVLISKHQDVMQE